MKDTKNKSQLGGTAIFHHQIALAFLVTNFNNLFKKGKKNLIATAETRIDYSIKKVKKYSSPDIIIWDYVNPINANFWLENTTTRGLKTNIKKTILAFDYLPNLNEAFVFDYQKKQFYKINRKDKKAINSSYSNAFSIDLSNLINGVN